MTRTTQQRRPPQEHSAQKGRPLNTASRIHSSRYHQDEQRQISVSSTAGGDGHHRNAILSKTPTTSRLDNRASTESAEECISTGVSGAYQHGILVGESSTTSLLLQTPNNDSSKTLDSIRPGHVFWHASPSPSQQLRQKRAHSSLTSHESLFAPLGTQAFRDELLGQGTIVNEMVTTSGQSSTNTLSSRETIGGSAANSSAVNLSRRFGRRTSRKSAITSMSMRTADQAEAVQGVQQILADLDRHIHSHIDDADPIQPDEKMLIEGLDRVFSSQEYFPCDDTNLCMQEKCFTIGIRKEETSRVPESLLSASEPSIGRVWNRTQSLPVQLAMSPRALAIQRLGDKMKRKSTTQAEERLQCCPKQSIIGQESVHPSTRRSSRGSEAISNQAKLAEPQTVRLSFGKRDVLLELEPQHSSPAVANCEMLEDVAPHKSMQRTKTRSSLSPPKKVGTTRTPRLGLIRPPSRSSQQLGGQHGLLAPFKRPTKVCPLTSTISKVPSSRSAEQEKSNREKPIVIEDSDEEETTVAHNSSVPPRRTSPRKKAADLQQRQDQHQPRTHVGSISKEEKKTATGEDNFFLDGDSSFDTSMDETMLCDAVAQAEASQIAPLRSQSNMEASDHLNGQLTTAKSKDTPASPALYDDSFEMQSSDNEAIVQAMEEGGW